MPLEIQIALDSDMDRIIDIQFAAFGSDVLNQLMFAYPIRPATKARFVKWAREDIEDPTITFLKAIDTEQNNEIVGFAKWYVYKEKRPESEWNKKVTKDWGEGTNVELVNEFFGKMREGRKRNMGGEPHCCWYPPSLHLAR